MKTLIILILLMNLPLWAQIQTPKTIEEERKALEEQKQKNDEWEQFQIKIVNESQAALKKNKEQLAIFESAEKNRKENLQTVANEIEQAIDGFSATQRLLSRKASFYRCVRSSVKDKGMADITQCKNSHQSKFTPEEEKQLAAWDAKVGLTPSALKIKKESLERQVVSDQNRLDHAQKQIGYAQDMRKRFVDSENAFKQREVDHELVKANQKYLNCDAATPEISLEEKVPYPGATFSGPFVGVPRDNQDGLGTCYANAAKNLLVGASKGQDVASFLDIALAYKGNGVVSDALDGGGSCTALERLAPKGFCPQTNAPMETGERNPYAPGLMGERGNIYDQAAVVNLLQKFLVGREVLQKGNKEFSEQLLKQAKIIVHNLKLRPNLKIPMPIVRHPIPSSWKLAEFQSIYARKNPGIGLDKVIEDYKNEYRKFYPTYVRGVVEGKSRDEIFDAFTDKMAPFITKYNVGPELKQWKATFMDDTNSDANDPALKKNISDSVDFMKIMSGKQGKSDSEFLKFCDDTQGDSLQFLTTLQPLIKRLSELKVNTDDMFDKDGKFRDSGELMQLMVAPPCLNPENRKKFSSPIACETGSLFVNQVKASGKPYGEKVKDVRGKVIASLLQGYPLGNTFDRHINTIVGMRFNKEQGRCEYKIRESQNATSTWQSEAHIFDEIEALTEVRRK